LKGPHFAGWDVYHVKGSPADPNRLFASTSRGWFGQVLQRSDDGGATCQASGNDFHYHGTPDPGQQGNSIIAFHREPDYQHIDGLAVGGTVSIQDKACHTFVYKVTQVWDLTPAKVTQLVPTSGL